MVHLITQHCSKTHQHILLPHAHAHTHKQNHIYTYTQITQTAHSLGVIIRSQTLAQPLWLWSRGCCLIYWSSMWVCVCRAFAYLLCHPAGSQLWAQHSGTMHLPRWQRAEYLLQTFGPSIVLIKLWCSRRGIYWNMRIFRLKYDHLQKSKSYWLCSTWFISGISLFFSVGDREWWSRVKLSSRFNKFRSGLT